MTALAFGGLYGWTTAWVLGGFVAFAVALPAFLWVESHKAEPLLDLSLFRIRLFAMGNLTSFLNGIARNGVLFLLVFYLQGVKGDDPVTAGILLAPLAIGLLVLSPISGALADRYGSRLLATAGMLVTALGLIGLTTIQVDTPYWQLALWQLIIGAGSGLFASPNASAVMGVVPPAQRGAGSGTRMMLTQSGFVISIALSIGLVTTAMDPQVLLSIFSGTQVGTGGHRPPAVHRRAPPRVRRGCRREPAGRRGVADARPAPGVGARPRRGHRRRVGRRGRSTRPAPVRQRPSDRLERAAFTLALGGVGWNAWRSNQPDPRRGTGDRNARRSRWRASALQ